MLPIPDRRHVGLTTYDAKDPETRFPQIAPLRPPAGAPNVLIVLLDDVGFGSSSAFGGPVSTPTVERLAADGLKFNRFHTTALCAPTRAALLTGRNHHAVGMGSVPDLATSAPGYSSIRPDDCAPLAQTCVAQSDRLDPDDEIWRELSSRDVVRELVVGVVRIWTEGAAVLRPIVHRAAHDPEVWGAGRS